mmetsp:Transcript_32250/g.72777  ORF Transcript_32250/g.72777 Transcript_32250/m.72777 type:complete len:286 (-) Transcript_32250:226-1083(-)
MRSSRRAGAPSEGSASSPPSSSSTRGGTGGSESGESGKSGGPGGPGAGAARQSGGEGGGKRKPRWPQNRGSKGRSTGVARRRAGPKKIGGRGRAGPCAPKQKRRRRRRRLPEWPVLRTARSSSEALSGPTAKRRGPRRARTTRGSQKGRLNPRSVEGRPGTTTKPQPSRRRPWEASETWHVESPGSEQPPCSFSSPSIGIAPVAAGPPRKPKAAPNPRSRPVRRLGPGPWKEPKRRSKKGARSTRAQALSPPFPQARRRRPRRASTPSRKPPWWPGPARCEASRR